jgi:hypothetical protein
VTRARRGGAWLAAGLAALGAWHLVLGARGRALPLITDEGEYAVAARAWADGGLPYRDAFSQKPPMVFAVYRAAEAVSSSPLAPRGAAALAVLLTMLALFLSAPRAWSAAGRLAGPAAYAALSFLPVGDYAFPANTEVFLDLFAALAALGVLRGAPLLAGLAAGAALCTKQTAAFTVLGLGALSVLNAPRRDRARAAFLYAAGAAAAPAAWAAYFAARGGLGAYWQSAWAGNARYAAVLLMTGALSGQLRWFLTTLGPLLLLYSLPALALSGFALRGLQAGRGRPVETLAVVWFGAAVAGALTGLFLFPHYFLQAAPPLALAAACGVERLKGPRVRAAAVILLAAWPALAAPHLIFADSARARGLKLLYPNPLFEDEVLGREIARRAAPGDALHVFGSEGSLFVYSGLRPATPYTLSYALTLFPPDADAWRGELARLRAAPPRFVVWSGQPLSTMIASRLGLRYRDALEDFLRKEGYRPAGWVDVTDSPALPVFTPAPKRAPAPWRAPEDRLTLLVRPQRKK